MTDKLINPNSVQKALEDHFDYFDENGDWACGGFTVTPLESIASDLAVAYLNQAAEIDMYLRHLTEGARVMNKLTAERDVLAEKLEKAVEALKEIAKQTKRVTPEPDNLQMAIGSIHSYARDTLAAITEGTDG